MSDTLFLRLMQVLAVAALLSLVFIPVMVIRVRRSAGAKVERFYEGIRGIRVDRQEQSGDVNLVYHTYSGSLTYVDQQRHDLVLPAEEAKVLLNRLHGFTCRYGFFAYGAAIIPILSLFEYRSQMRKN